MPLDVHTLLLLVTTLFTLSTMSLALLWWMHKQRGELAYWTIGMGLIPCGSGLLYARDAIPAVLSIVAGNMLLFVGVALIVAGNAVHTGRRPKWWALGLTLVVPLVAFSTLYDDPTQLSTRVVVNSMTLALLSFWAAHALAGGTKETRRPPSLGQKAMAGVFVVIAIIDVVRALAEILWVTTNDRTIWTGTVSSLYHLGLTMNSVLLASGFPIMVAEDLRNELRARIADLDRARGIAENALQEQRNFLTMISHEFRTPLGIINVSASIIEQHTREEDRLLRAETDRIRRSSRRLSDLVEECLHEDFLTNAATAIRPDHMDLRKVLESLAAEYEISFRALTDDEPIIFADAHLLPVALSCAIANACKYGRGANAVELHLHTPSEAERSSSIVIDVCDDGPGIPDDERERVFERYYRAPHGSRKPGSGLGLFLARRIVGLHGGHLDVSAVDAGEPLVSGAWPGCRLRFVLPWRQAKVPAATKA